MHSQISGTVDFREPNDHLCIARIRSLVERWAVRRARLRSHCQPKSPRYRRGTLRHLRRRSRRVQYDMNEIIARLVDRSRVRRVQARVRRDRPLRLRAHRRLRRRHRRQPEDARRQQTDHSGNKRIEFGGVIYTESAEKAARFIMDCNQNLVPLIFLHDVNGFMVGRDAEWSGIIRAGAKMVNAVSNSVVPKITVIVGGSFGAGHYAMCGKAYDPRFIFAWPTAKYAVMSGGSAAGTLVEIKVKQLERGGKKLSEEEKKELCDSVKATYDQQMDPRYGAARLWIDKIIDPRTRGPRSSRRSNPARSIPTSRSSR